MRCYACHVYLRVTLYPAEILCSSRVCNVDLGPSWVSRGRSILIDGWLSISHYPCMRYYNGIWLLHFYMHHLCFIECTQHETGRRSREWAVSSQEYNPKSEVRILNSGIFEIRSKNWQLGVGSREWRVRSRHLGAIAGVRCKEYIQ